VLEGLPIPASQTGFFPECQLPYQAVWQGQGAIEPDEGWLLTTVHSVAWPGQTVSVDFTSTFNRGSRAFRTASSSDGLAPRSRRSNGLAGKIERFAITACKGPIKDSIRWGPYLIWR